MITRIHKKNGKFGHSFMGATAYLIHDKEQSSSDRVAWTATHNLITQKPETAARVMAGTAMNQDDLKREAGMKAGRKSTQGPVLHYSISWHEDEAEGLTQEEMLRAAKASLAAVGVNPANCNRKKASDPKRKQMGDEHQALFVCHQDEPQPHVHILVNRVHPEHGLFLPDNNDRLKLSDWALEYEKKRGEILCRQREINQRARTGKVKIWTKDKSPPRNIHELERPLQDAANDNAIPELPTLRDEERRKNAVLMQRGDEINKAYREKWNAFQADFQAQKAALLDQEKTRISSSKSRFQSEYQTKLEGLHTDQQEQREAFREADRQGMLNKAKNIGDALKLVSHLRGESEICGQLKDWFTPFAGAGARLEILKRVQEAEIRAVEADRDAQIQSAIVQANQQRKIAQRLAMSRYSDQKAYIVAKHQEQTQALKDAWKKRNAEQRNNYAVLKAKLERLQIKPTYNRAASPLPQDKKSADGRSLKPSKVDDFKAKLSERRSVKGFKEAMRRSAREQDNDRER